MATPSKNPEQVLQKIRDAIEGYYYALDTRQHGGVAQNTAFSAIERALVMSWVETDEARQARAENHRKRSEQNDTGDTLQNVRAAVEEYYYALDTRQHGEVAQDKAIKAIEAALGMHWVETDAARAERAEAHRNRSGQKK